MGGGVVKNNTSIFNLAKYFNFMGVRIKVKERDVMTSSGISELERIPWSCQFHETGLVFVVLLPNRRDMSLYNCLLILSSWQTKPDIPISKEACCLVFLWEIRKITWNCSVWDLEKVCLPLCVLLYIHRDHFWEGHCEKQSRSGDFPPYLWGQVCSTAKSCDNCDTAN